MQTKMSRLVNEYKSIAKQIRTIAKRYRQLDKTIRVYNIRTPKVVNEYNELWKQLMKLNNRGYCVMCKIRNLAETPLYRTLRCMGVCNMHGFRYTDETRTWFKYDQLVNIAYLHV